MPLLLCTTLGLSACGSDRVYTLGELGAGQERQAENGSRADAGELPPEDGSIPLVDIGDPGMEAEAPEPAVIYVYVCGAVCEPAVAELPEGSRVRDALDAAGGFAEDADTTYVNLARTLKDGEQIYVPTREETAELGAGIGTSGGGFPAEPGSGGETSGSSGLVNINTADEVLLCTLPGIGSAKAKAIIAYREEHGAFSSPEELKNISGIGDASYEKLAGLITVR